MKFELKPIKTWVEMNEGFKAGTLRIYISNIHLGWAEPVKGLMELYTFSERRTGIILVVPEGNMPLSDILMHIELSLKEFVKKVTK